MNGLDASVQHVDQVAYTGEKLAPSWNPLRKVNFLDFSWNFLLESFDFDYRYVSWKHETRGSA